MDNLLAQLKRKALQSVISKYSLPESDLKDESISMEDLGLEPVEETESSEDFMKKELDLKDLEQLPPKEREEAEEKLLKELFNTEFDKEEKED